MVPQVQRLRHYQPAYEPESAAKEVQLHRLYVLSIILDEHARGRTRQWDRGTRDNGKEDRGDDEGYCMGKGCY